MNVIPVLADLAPTEFQTLATARLIFYLVTRAEAARMKILIRYKTCQPRQAASNLKIRDVPSTLKVGSHISLHSGIYIYILECLRVRLTP